MVIIAQVGYPTLLFLGALAITILVLLIRVQRNYGRPRTPQASWPAQLDGKMAALEQLIREADRAAARLEAAQAAARGEERLASPPTTRAEGPHAPLDPSTEPPPASQAEGLRSAGPVDVAPAARPPAERRYEEIYTLADCGLGASEIAHRVGSPVGEVELILSLRGRRQ